jgi:ATP-dependent helicase/nuclease subunit A
MSATFEREPRLPFDEGDAAPALKDPPRPVEPPRPLVDDVLPDAAARRFAVDPSRNVVLEASAGTGKTRVLVERYVNLLRAGVEPQHILAITFTRKAAAEMRARIIDRLREAGRLSPADLSRWRDLKDRLGDIAISTIDAFCLSLLREFPLEADVDPGFELADETQVPRLVDESLDQALRICRSLAREDDDVALVFAQLGERRLRAGLRLLVDRRLVAPAALRRYLERGPRDLSAAAACARAAERLSGVLAGVRGGLEAFLDDGPAAHPQFALLASDIHGLCAAGGRLDGTAAAGSMGAPENGDGRQRPDLPDRREQAMLRAFIDRLRAYFLTQEGRPREGSFSGTGFKAIHCKNDAAWRRHRQAAAEVAPAVAEAVRSFRRDLNIVMSRGIWRIFAVALQRYGRTLEAHALVDFSGVLERAVALLAQMDEFAQSRFRLEARYRHVLVDEFQDTSRAQWDLVAHLVRCWGEGFGAGADALTPSIFVVGDRKQSIYGFRDADVAVLDEAISFIDRLRPGSDSRRAITVSFRAVPALLAFVNDVFDAIDKAPEREDAFRYDDRDRFPLPAPETWTRAEGGAERPPDSPTALSVIVGETVRAAADRVAREIVGLLGNAIVRDRATGLRRPAQPADVAVLFRARDSHREFEKALERRSVSTYVHKGLGFFEADEIQDAVALLRYLANPQSNLRAATFLRSRIVRLSDPALAVLRPHLASALLASETPAATTALSSDDRRVLGMLRQAIPRWLSWVDRLTPSELLSTILDETAYAYETRGPGCRQARENLKKLRSIVGRFQNRGYATLARVADHLDQLAIGDESNASIDARDSVSLMTVHAAKGLEFPVVFIVNLGRGTGGVRAPIRVVAHHGGDASVAVADYQSEADGDAQARDREESKRLLYVALTRARDRLYLSATVQDGVCRMGRGSLGETLPGSLKALFVEAAASGTDADTVLSWPGPSGRLHPIVVNARRNE